MLGFFDRDKFAELLIMAIGDRTASAFAAEANISRNQVSLWLRKKTNFKPKMSTLKNLANFAQNNVSYVEFLDACGYIADSTEQSHINDLLSTADLKKNLRQDFGIYRVDQLANIKSTAAADFPDLGNTIIAFLQENDISQAELYQCLQTLRDEKQKKKQKK